MPKFSLIVTCKGRLMHLRQTLPLFCALSDTEVIVVDYGCPDRSGDWVAAHHPAVKVVRIDDDPGFNPSRARNIAARDCQSDYLLFVDADIKVRPGARIGLKLPVERPVEKVGGDMDWQFELTMTMKPKDAMAFRQKYQNPLLYRK